MALGCGCLFGMLLGRGLFRVPVRAASRGVHGSVATRLYEYRESADGVVSKQQLDELLKAGPGDYRLVDVREPVEHQHGLIPTAETVPLSQLPLRFPPHSGDGDQPPSPQHPDIICYCRSGIFFSPPHLLLNLVSSTHPLAPVPTVLQVSDLKEQWNTCDNKDTALSTIEAASLNTFLNAAIDSIKVLKKNTSSGVLSALIEARVCSVLILVACKQASERADEQKRDAK